MQPFHESIGEAARADPRVLAADSVTACRRVGRALLGKYQHLRDTRLDSNSAVAERAQRSVANLPRRDRNAGELDPESETARRRTRIDQCGLEIDVISDELSISREILCEQVI